MYVAIQESAKVETTYMTNLVLGANTVLDGPQCRIAFTTSSLAQFGQQLGLLCLPLDERRKAIYSPVYLYSTTPWATLDNVQAPTAWQLDLTTLFDKGVYHLQMIAYVYDIPGVNLEAIELDDISLTINHSIHYTFKSTERHVKAVIVLELYQRGGVYKCRALGETSTLGLEAIEQHVETSLNAKHPHAEAIRQQVEADQQAPNGIAAHRPNSGNRPPRQVPAGEQWTATAFAIDDYHLLTSHHVIESASLLGIRQQGQADREVQVVISDVGGDMAILKVSEPLPSYLTLAHSTGDLLGETITTLGFPLSGLNHQLQVTQGCISGLTGYNNDIRYMQFTAPIQPGSSGSPLLLPTGEVVGMVAASLSQAQNLNYAVKFQLLSALLASAGLAVTQPHNQAMQNKPTKPSLLTTPELSRLSRGALWMVGAQA